MSERARSLLKVVEIDLNRRRHLRSWVEQMSRVHNTPDVRRLRRKLGVGDGPFLLLQARGFGALIGADLSEVRRDLNFDLSLSDDSFRRDLSRWVVSSQAWLREVYPPERLDWLWSCSWTYQLRGMRGLTRRGFRVYAAVRGPRPPSLEANLPFQAALNVERKRRSRRWERAVFLAVKRGEREELLALGLSEHLVIHALRRYRCNTRD